MFEYRLVQRVVEELEWAGKRLSIFSPSLNYLFKSSTSIHTPQTAMGLARAQMGHFNWSNDSEFKMLPSGEWIRLHFQHSQSPFSALGFGTLVSTLGWCIQPPTKPILDGMWRILQLCIPSTFEILLSTKPSFYGLPKMLLKRLQQPPFFSPTSVSL